MGNTNWKPDDWQARATQTQHQTQHQIFTSRSLDPSLDPLQITVRESVDSDANPNSTPIILAPDQTGSMGFVATEIIKNGLGVIMNNILDRKPVSDPHVMCMAIGDSLYGNEQAPLQVTQFEAGVDAIVEQIKKIYIEGNGGGNDGEAYMLAWYFAATKTLTDCAIKRGKKGFLFTIGDEPIHTTLTAREIRQYVDAGYTGEDVSAKDLLDLVSQNWEVFHLNVDGANGHYDQTTWTNLLGERAIHVSDHKKLGEIIVSILQVLGGEDVKAVADSWGGGTALVVSNALSGLTKTGGASTGVVTL